MDSCADIKQEPSLHKEVMYSWLGESLRRPWMVSSHPVVMVEAVCKTIDDCTLQLSMGVLKSAFMAGLGSSV